MLYLYLVLSAALIPILDRFVPILKTAQSWWLVPVLYVAFVIGLLLIHTLILWVSLNAINIEKSPEPFSRYYRWLLKISLPMLFKLALVKIHVSGAEKIPENTHVLFVCNHLHNFDPPIILSLFPELELAFIGKKDIYRTMPLVAKVMHKLHCIPIDRENDREALKAIIEAIRLLKEDRFSIGLFPEGYASKSGNLLPMRNGSFRIALKAKVPIVVSVISNTKTIRKNMFRRRTHVYLDILEVIMPEEFEDLNTVQVGERVTALMQEGIARRKENL